MWKGVKRDVYYDYICKEDNAKNETAIVMKTVGWKKTLKKSFFSLIIKRLKRLACLGNVSWMSYVSFPCGHYCTYSKGSINL